MMRPMVAAQAIHENAPNTAAAFAHSSARQPLPKQTKRLAFVLSAIATKPENLRLSVGGRGEAGRSCEPEDHRYGLQTDDDPSIV